MLTASTTRCGFIDPDGMKEISVEDCKKDSNCTVVALNVILDKNANNGNGLTADEMKNFNGVLQGAKDDLGNGNVALDVTYTSGEVTNSGVSGLDSSKANLFLSAYVPMEVTQNALVSGSLNGATVPDPRSKLDVMFISANNAQSELIGSGVPFVGSFTNTITHEFMHFLSGDTGRTGDNAFTRGWHEFQIDRQASGLHYDISSPSPGQIQRARMYSPPVPSKIAPGNSFLTENNSLRTDFYRQTAAGNRNLPQTTEDNTRQQTFTGSPRHPGPNIG
jgi:hypothetical protein